MANIIHAGGGGNPAIAEMWCGTGSLANNSPAQCAGHYLINGANLKLSSYSFDQVWYGEARNDTAHFKPVNSGSLHCLMVPSYQKGTVSISSVSGASYTSKTYSSDSKTAFEFWFTNMTAGTQVNVTFRFSFGAIHNMLMLVYDD